MTVPKSLIINPPYACPQQYRHKQQDRGASTTLKSEVVEDHRPASYGIFDTPNNTNYEAELPLANKIREHIQTWREAGYHGVTGFTRNWHDNPDLNNDDTDKVSQSNRLYPLYFCQLEAIENNGGRVTTTNNKTSFGAWYADVIFEPSHTQDILTKHSGKP